MGPGSSPSSSHAQMTANSTSVSETKDATFDPSAMRSREVPFILEHGQIVGRLVYEKMLGRPKSLYGERIGSNYQAQGLKLSKHFRTE